MAIANPVGGLLGPGLINKAGGWFIAIAVVFILLGVISIMEPVVAGLAVAILVGWVLIMGGLAHLLATFDGVGAGQSIWQGSLGIIYIVGGIYFLKHPFLGLGTLTLLLAGIILAEALLRFIAYFQTRSEGGSKWMLVNSLITLLLGGLIWVHWPSSSAWAIGTLVGLNLLMTGFARLMLGLAARRLASRFAA
jgi:uncharacterized membrane protein HdeD (DUF308 family)